MRATRNRNLILAVVIEELRSLHTACILHIRPAHQGHDVSPEEIVDTQNFVTVKQKLCTQTRTEEAGACGLQNAFSRMHVGLSGHFPRNSVLFQSPVSKLSAEDEIVFLNAHTILLGRGSMPGPSRDRVRASSFTRKLYVGNRGQYLRRRGISLRLE